jgi:hypothetical protein
MKTRLSIGDGADFVTHVISLASLVALITASQAVTEVVRSAVPPASGGASVLLSSFLAEIELVLSAWLVPVWLLTAGAAFVVTLHSTRSFEGTSALLSELGAERSASASLSLVRGVLLASASFVLGLSFGLVAAQLVFRAFLVVFGAQYFVPLVTPAVLGFTAALSLSALFSGFAAAALASRSRRR